MNIHFLIEKEVQKKDIPRHLKDCMVPSLRGSKTTEAISWRVEKERLPRSLKDDIVVILRKCPWSAITPGEGEGEIFR